jgi:hypothetical protein
LVVRSCSEVEIVGEELRHNGVMHQLHQLASLFGDTHRFVGVLDCRHDHSDVETPFRVRIVGNVAQEIWPVMFWPDDAATAVIRTALGNFDRSIDQRAQAAKAILAGLVDAYTTKG